jgi:hypothetical protein
MPTSLVNINETTVEGWIRRVAVIEEQHFLSPTKLHGWLAMAKQRVEEVLDNEELRDFRRLCRNADLARSRTVKPMGAPPPTSRASSGPVTSTATAPSAAAVASSGGSQVAPGG